MWGLPRVGAEFPSHSIPCKVTVLPFKPLGLLLAWKKSLLLHNGLFPIISIGPAVSLVLPYQCKSKDISVPCDQHSVRHS